MQATKDSFYIALRDRLVAIDPGRTVTLDGATRPAIAVLENEPANSGPPLCDTFYLHWGKSRLAGPAARNLMAIDCTISYCTGGSEQNNGQDRGRDLTSLDSDLLAMCSPPHAAKCDYSTGSPEPLGTTIFWTEPVVNAAKSAPAYAGHEAAVTVFFYPEVKLP